MSEPITITSRQNARLIHARKVRDGKIPDEIFVEGMRVVAEALRSEVRVRQCFVTDELAGTDLGKAVSERLASDGGQLVRIPEDLFRSVSDTVRSQGIALIAQRPETGREVVERSLERDGKDHVVLLFEANDPSNVGAVCRVAEAAGAGGLILTRGSADAFSAKALRAGMGSNLRLAVWDQAVLADTIAWARSKGLRIVATDTSAKTCYSSLNWKNPSLVIFGSEAHGLEGSIIALADDVIAIPMQNGVESLNLAVSAGIVLFEALRQNS